MEQPKTQVRMNSVYRTKEELEHDAARNPEVVSYRQEAESDEGSDIFVRYDCGHVARYFMDEGIFKEEGRRPSEENRGLKELRALWAVFLMARKGFSRGSVARDLWNKQGWNMSDFLGDYEFELFASPRVWPLGRTQVRQTVDLCQ